VVITKVGPRIPIVTGMLLAAALFGLLIRPGHATAEGVTPVSEDQCVTPHPSSGVGVTQS
jgi:hypothetical protein